MKIAVPKETRPGECRVALVPESCKKLAQAGYEVLVEAGAGGAAGFPDAAYAEVGARLVPDAAALLGEGDFVLKVTAPQVAPVDEVRPLRRGALLLASLMPTRHLDTVRALASQGVTAFSTDAIPRTTRAQAMDTLSSMANIIGYKGVLMGALELGKYFPMFMTAAGTVFPANVFVIGAGVAGLQAIATARRVGAKVTATDVRPEVKEQIESVGGRYVGIELKESAAAGGGYAKELSEEDKARQRELLAEQCAQSDVVISTALIGGVFAPQIISAAIVGRMKPGAVIVDVAIDQGGCVETSRPTTHEDPIFIVDNVVHYCVANMPGAVGRTSTYALTNVTLPYALKIADHGWPEFARRDSALAQGVNMVGGVITCKPVAEAFNLSNYVPIDDVLK